MMHKQIQGCEGWGEPSPLPPFSVLKRGKSRSCGSNCHIYCPNYIVQSSSKIAVGYWTAYQSRLYQLIMLHAKLTKIVVVTM